MNARTAADRVAAGLAPAHSNQFIDVRLPFRTAILVFALALTGITGCVKNPVTEKRELHMLSEKAELQLGQETKKQIIKEYGLFMNPKVQAYINEVGNKVVQGCERKNVPYEFVIVDTPLVNAFAVPGAVFLTRGILELIDDEAELAGVIGHEIGHITGFHAVKLIQKSLGYQFLSTFATVALALYGPRADDPRAYAVINQATNLVAAGFLSGYGREFELEADRSGLRYAVLAGYDPDAMISFFKRMKSLGEEKATGIEVFLRSHPPTDDRIKQVKKILTEYAEKTAKAKGRTKTDKRVEQVLKSNPKFSDNFERYQEIVRSVPKTTTPPTGIIKDNRFQDPALGVELEVPKGWKLEISYGQSLVSFYKLDGAAQGELQMKKIDLEPLLTARQTGALAGVSISTQALTSKDWGESVEEALKMEKRTGRETTYPSGLAYIGTYRGIDRRGRPAFFKILYLVRGTARNSQEGYVLFCAAPEDTYLDYLIDFEQIMGSLKFR